MNTFRSRVAAASVLTVGAVMGACSSSEGDELASDRASASQEAEGERSDCRAVFEGVGIGAVEASFDRGGGASGAMLELARLFAVPLKNGNFSKEAHYSNLVFATSRTDAAEQAKSEVQALAAECDDLGVYVAPEDVARIQKDAASRAAEMFDLYGG